MATDIGGVWRTVGGRRIFIKDGEDLKTAMKKSGKFKRTKKEENSKFELPDNWKHNMELNWEDEDEYKKIDDALQKKVDELVKESKEMKPYSDEQMEFQKKIVDAQEDIIYARQRHKRAKANKK